MTKEFIPGFGISNNKGFHIRFENGWTVSVQFGYGNYCTNYDLPREEIEKSRGANSHTAEIAAWDINDVWHVTDGSAVSGYKTPTQVLEFINEIAAKPKVEKIQAA